MSVDSLFELSVDRVCHDHDVMSESDVNDASGERGSAFGGTLMRVSNLRIP